MNEKNVRSIPELFGSMVFSQAQMRQRLPERVYDAWQQCLIQGTSLDRSIADEITASLDPDTSGQIMENLLALPCMVVAITHDVSGAFMKRFDKVYRVEHGSVSNLL